MDALKRKLEYHYKFFDRSKISPDPLEFLHLYKDGRDIELTGLISSIFAYGRVEQIIATLGRLNDIMEHRPAEFVENYDFARDRKIFQYIKHRFYTPDEISLLFHILHRVYTGYGSLKTLFLLYYFDEDSNIKNSLSFFSNNLLSLAGQAVSPALAFMFPDPLKGSACKRMNLFLRWMVRKDELDFGLWREIPRSKLVIPVDTHIANICRSLKLTTAKNVSWKMAEEITQNLQKYDYEDPVKYDFAICHIGMRKMKF